MRDYRDDWDELARREPYFAVITDPRFLSGRFDEDARQRFFESGEADVEQLLSAIGHDFRPATALDYGCGVGRLTLPLARRMTHVTGCDISPAMIALARENAAAAGATNIEFVSSLSDLRAKKFDLICSLLVFQHTPVSEGLSTLSTLLQLLAPGGVAALHFTLRRPGGPLRRVARRVRAAIPLLHRIAARLEGDRLALPYMQMNEYDEREIQRRFSEVIGEPALVVPRREGNIEGAIFIGRFARPRTQ